jgi:hypothetical protein
MFFANLGLAQELLEYQSNQVSGIEIKRTLAQMRMQSSIN